MGRPTDYTDEIANAICQRVADGESLRAICRDSDFPSRSAVHAWLLKDEHANFADHYAQAQLLRQELMFDEVTDLADDLMEQPLSGEIVQAQRVRIDSRKWALGRMNRSKYGDHSSHEVSGKGGGEIRFSWREPASPQPPESTTEEG